MASLMTVRIDKGNSPNLGFRLQGGKDFGTPLVIQKVPLKKNVEIKGNITTTLREAALLIKEQEEEVNKIETILKGGSCTQLLEEALIEERRNKEKQEWQDIQRKHLMGLITFEESILAKKKLLDENRARFLEIQAEKIELHQQLEEFKEREQEKVKAQVNGGSPAERAGLIAGDSVIKINNIDVFNLRHKDAQDVVVRAGHAFELTIQRGGSTWKPSVIPTGSLHSPTNYNNVSPVTRTSLAANKGENIGSIGTGHNLSAKPFSPQVNGSVNGGPKLVNKPYYNSPSKLYSEESIAETLSAQTEVLSTGALGVNFKKNERNYDSSNSEVLRALKEAENEPDYHDQEPDSGVVYEPNRGVAGLRHVQAPETRPQPPNPQLPPGQNICADCERLIVGVFVRIKDKNLHVECFKCSTCGASLKNAGYYNINNKLYCDVHAKSAALKSQQNPNLVPVTVNPGGRLPAQAISSVLSNHSYPTSSPLSPKLNTSGSQYQGEESKENVEVASSLPVLAQSNVSDSNTSNNNLLSNSTPRPFSNYLKKTSSFSGPRPFSSVSSPLSPHNTLPRAAPLSPVALAPSFNHSYTPSAYSPSSEHANELCHAKETENILELDEISLQIPNQPPPPPPVPVYSQINVSIPFQSVSPQLDSIGSSPRSDYSSYSSSSGKNAHTTETTRESREKIVTEIKSLTPKLKSVHLSDTQSPRMNYIVSNVETTITDNDKKVTSELFIPINNYSNSSDILNLPDHLTFKNKEDHLHFSDKFDHLNNSRNNPDHLIFSTKPDHFSRSENLNYFNKSDHLKSSNNKEADVKGISKVFINSSVTKDAADFKPSSTGAAPICWKCNHEIVRGPFITALGKIWCPNHFICATPSCRRPLQDIGFVEERGQLYCEYCFEQYLAPPCSKCGSKIKGDCLKAIGKNFHPECFNCTYCGKLFGNSPFFLEDGSPYCEADWNELFTTKCYACAFPIEAGDRWVEALSNNYHSQCFNCTMCKKNLEGQSFFAKGGRPFCKTHAR